MGFGVTDMVRDRYSSYGALAAANRRGKDYVIRARSGRSPLLIMAPHGGGIEPGSDALADAIAGEEHGFYTFAGVRCAGNLGLHLTSSRFDEPLGLGMARGADIVLAVHGCTEREPAIFLGGRHRGLRRALQAALRRAGFAAGASPRRALCGVSARNISNRGRQRAGVQLEISEGLRYQLFRDPGEESVGAPRSRFYGLVGAVRDALAAGKGVP